MKTNDKCPKCGCNEYETHGAMKEYTMRITIKYPFRICNNCNHRFPKYNLNLDLDYLGKEVLLILKQRLNNKPAKLVKNPLYKYGLNELCISCAINDKMRIYPKNGFIIPATLKLIDYINKKYPNYYNCVQLIPQKNLIESHVMCLDTLSIRISKEYDIKKYGTKPKELITITILLTEFKKCQD